jgi:hypothetical protein
MVIEGKICVLSSVYTFTALIYIAVIATAVANIALLLKGRVAHHLMRALASANPYVNSILFSPD